MRLLPCVAIPTRQPPIASVIWLHGLGADGHDFASVVPLLNLPREKPIRFIFPHAPSIPVTMNNGYIMPAWFDVVALDGEPPADETGILQSIAYIEALIQHENDHGVPTNKIILAGFSQGGAIALLTALLYKESLAGVMGLSTYLPLQKKLVAERSKANKSIPIFLAHGKNDPVLPLALGKESKVCLDKLGYKVRWHEYSMEHTVCDDELKDISRWITKLPALA